MTRPARGTINKSNTTTTCQRSTAVKQQGGHHLHIAKCAASKERSANLGHKENSQLPKMAARPSTHSLSAFSRTLTCNSATHLQPLPTSLAFCSGKVSSPEEMLA